MIALDPVDVRKAAAFVDALNDICERFGAILWPDEDDGPAVLPFTVGGDTSPKWRAQPITPPSDRFGLVVPS